jgi:hypothetical protein
MQANDVGPDTRRALTVPQLPSTVPSGRVVPLSTDAPAGRIRVLDDDNAEQAP